MTYYFKKNILVFLFLTASNYIFSQAVPVPPLVYKNIPKAVKINFETMYPQKVGGGFRNKNYISSTWQKINDTIYEIKITQVSKSIIFSRYYKNGTWQLTGESLPVVLNKVSGLPPGLNEVWNVQYKSASIISAAKVTTPFHDVLYEVYFMQKNIKTRRFFLENGFAIDKLE